MFGRSLPPAITSCLLFGASDPKPASPQTINALPSKDERASRGATLLSRLRRCSGGLRAITGSPGDAYSVGQERASCRRESFGIPAPGRPSLRLRWRPFQPGWAIQPLPRDHLSATRLAGTPPFLSLSSYGADMPMPAIDCRPILPHPEQAAQPVPRRRAPRLSERSWGGKSAVASQRRLPPAQTRLTNSFSLCAPAATEPAPPPPRSSTARSRRTARSHSPAATTPRTATAR